jgi:spore coat protein U-like protein
MKHFSKLVALAALCGFIAAAQSATVAQSFGVKLVVQESCTISSTTTDVDFGTKTRQTAAINTDATGSFSVTCTSGTPYTIALNGGLHPNGTTSRRMISGANYAAYGLYTSSTYATQWGDGTTFGSVIGGTGTGAAVATPVYGRMTSLNFPAGTYNDTVTATVTY